MNCANVIHTVLQAYRLLQHLGRQRSHLGDPLGGPRGWLLVLLVAPDWAQPFAWDGHRGKGRPSLLQTGVMPAALHPHLYTIASNGGIQAQGLQYRMPLDLTPGDHVITHRMCTVPSN